MCGPSTSPAPRTAAGPSTSRWHGGSVPIYRYTSGNPARERKMAFSTHVLPRLAATSDSLALGWVEAIDGGPTVQFLVARSHDGGKTFAPPVPVHSANASRPGFTTLTADAGGGLACGWLSNQQPYFSAAPAGSEGFTRRAARVRRSGGKRDLPVLRRCRCRDAGAHRPGRLSQQRLGTSRHLARKGRCGAATGDKDEASFSTPVAVTQEPWTFSGCPHDGPSLALVGDRIHLAWMDAHTGTGRVYHAVGPVADPLRPPAPAPEPASPGRRGPPQLAADSKGHLHAVWDEGLAPDPVPPADAKTKTGEHRHQHAAPAAGGGRAIMYAVSRDGERRRSRRPSAGAKPGGLSTPTLLTLGPEGTVFVTWNEIDQDGKHVVFARLTRPDQPQEPRTR